jgi:cell division protein ZapA
MHITINNKPYEIFCGSGEEGKVSSAAQKFNERVATIKQSIPNAGHEMLIVIAALILQDELSDQLTKPHAHNEEIADALDSISGYVEKLADGLK